MVWGNGVSEKDTGLHSVARTAVLLLAALWFLFIAVTAIWLYQSYDTTNRRTAERLEAATKIVATNASWISALASQALRRIDETLPESIGMTAGSQIRNINDAVEGLPGGVQAYVVDASGRTVYSTDPDIKPIDIRDRDYFTALEKGAPDYLSSLLVSRLNGQQIFVFSKRLERQGKFAGAAMVSFETNVLAAVWAAVDLGSNSTVSLIRNDGMLVARYPPAEGPLDMSKYVLFTDYLQNKSAGTYEAISPLDAEHRMVGYQRIPGTSMVAVAALDYSDAMIPFRRNALAALVLGIVTTFGAAIAGWWIRNLYQRDARKTEQLQTVNDQNALLLREIHHRVKNNLQAVQSLLRMQRLPQPIQTALSTRIMAMVAVHEQIYKHDAFAKVDLQTLIPSVAGKAVEAYDTSVSVTYEIAPLEVGNDQATSIALLVNEIVTNSLKYAFQERDDRRIAISLTTGEGGQATMAIADNGIGFDGNAQQPGMGSRLIEGVVRQLNGRFRYEMDNGTRFVADIDLQAPGEA